jgi:protocatechuate 3,4-dioxygenase, beta subunit
MNEGHFWGRRQWMVATAASGLAFFTTKGLFAEELFRTPALTEGPFYPDHLPLDQDNDLIVIKDSITPAVGEITHLSGKILSAKGSPLRNVTIEIWQCDAKGVYLHSSDSNSKRDVQDKFFQGYGKFETGATGEYRFRTIKPVPYPGRPAPHIHIKLSRGGRELLTTQLMIRGHEGNARDGIFRQAGDLVDQELVMADFVPIKETKTPEFNAKFDIVLGVTPDDRELKS